MQLRPLIIISLFLCMSTTTSAESSVPSLEFKGTLQDYSRAPHRSEKNIDRNEYRHPVKTLEFFGLKPKMTVVEIWPGSGWYTEILAPFLSKNGTYYAAHFPKKSDITFFNKSRKQFRKKLDGAPNLYDKVKLTSLFPPANDRSSVPAGSADLVLTFRNVHNWSKGNYDEAMFKAFHAMLKPGGVLGIVEHRALIGSHKDNMIESGYMTEEYVITLAKRAGFTLTEKSEINANSKDSTKHPKGVWSLPPTLREGETNKPYYMNVGESDRMTLKFTKEGK